MDKEKLLQQTIKNTRSVLLPNRDGLLLDAFEKEYRGFFGFPFPYQRLGFANTMDLVESLHHLNAVGVERLPSGHILLKGIPDKNTEHVSRMVKNQRRNEEGYNRRTAQIIRQQGHSFRRHIEKTQVTDAAREVPNHTKAVVEDLMLEHEDGLAVADFCRAFHEKEGYKLEFTSWGFLNLQDFLYYGLGDMLDLKPVEGHHGIEWLIFPKRHLAETPLKLPADSQTSNDQTKEKMRVSDLVSDQMKTEFESILKVKEGGLTADKFAEEYEKLFGRELAPRQFGCQTVLEMCLWLPDIFQINLDGGEWTFKGKQKEFLKEEKEIVSAAQIVISSDPLEECNLDVTEHIKANVKRVLMKHPHGLAYHKFRRAYLDTIGNNLEAKSLESFFKCPGISHLLHLKKESEKVVIMPSLEITKNISNKRKDVMGSQSELIQQELPSDRRVGDFIEVIVNEVVSPHKFWIRINGNTSRAMDCLMDQMDTFYYSCKSVEYKIPAFHVTAGLLCATLFTDGTWHRAQVKEVVDETRVEVFFLDYGTNAKVRMDTLMYLHKNFGELPAQAIQARLAGVKPVGGKARFSKEAKNRFLQLMKSSPEGGRRVAAIGGLKPLLVLWLMDKGGLPVSHILVEEGLVEVDVKLVETTKRDHISHLLNEP